ncbi:HPP family protein [Candidatus Bipolaricaulota bacterium]|nr:HPP family protein [Candidatus Bipolaricaulota bacterium]
MKFFSKSFKEKWGNYLWQSAGAGLSILLLITFTRMVGLVLIAAAGSTAFTVFGLPHNRTARTRNIIGGNLIAAFVGLACSYLGPLWVAGGVAVGSASFLMVLVDAEHPPAAGAALGLAISPSFPEVAFVVVSALTFALIRIALLPYLKDLY